MVDPAHNSLVQAFKTAITEKPAPLNIKFKVEGKVLFEIEIENSHNPELEKKLCLVVSEAINQATLKIVQNEIQKNNNVCA